MAVPQSSPTRLGPPASGAYICVDLSVEANAVTSASTVRKTKLPAGMEAVLVAVLARSQSVTSDPAIIVGNSTDTDGYVASANLTTAIQELSIAGALAANSRAVISAGGQLVVTVTNDAGDAHGDVDVKAFLYVTEHASNIPDV